MFWDIDIRSQIQIAIYCHFFWWHCVLVGAVATVGVIFKNSKHRDNSTILKDSLLVTPLRTQQQSLIPPEETFDQTLFVWRTWSDSALTQTNHADRQFVPSPSVACVLNNQKSRRSAGCEKRSTNHHKMSCRQHGQSCPGITFTKATSVMEKKTQITHDRANCQSRQYFGRH